jgi:hypothetical protein
MFSVTTNTYIFFVNYENSCKGKIKSAYMQNRNKIARCGKKEYVVPSYDFDMDDMDY